MLVMAAMTVLCTASVAFYVRFLIALCKECRPRRIGYWGLCDLTVVQTRLQHRRTAKHQ